MIKNMPTFVTGDLLKVLCDMGHGDRIAIVDANFPANRYNSKIVDISGCGSVEVLEAVLKLISLDHIERYAYLMEMTPEDKKRIDRPEIWEHFEKVIKTEDKDVNMEFVSREEFYNMTENCYAIIHTGEKALYGNVCIVKGVL